VEADWHELMVLQQIMWPTTVCDNGQLNGHAVQPADIPLPQSASLGVYPIAHIMEAAIHFLSQ